MLLAYRLVRLIESHSEELAANLLKEVTNSEKTKAYITQVPREELRSRTHEIYQNLGEWLLGKTESEVEHRYQEIGARRASQGVPRAELISSLIMTKDTVWDFLLKEAGIEWPVEVFGELELLQLLDQFFDRAMYYASIGYERAETPHAVGARHGAA
jgi:hypothetical protein